MKNKVLTIALCIILAATMFAVTGCGENATVNNAEETVEKSKGNYDVFGCMEKLDASMKLEEMNEVIGFEGEKTSETESYTVYKWELTEKTSITSQFHTSSGTATISANYPNEMIKEKADFSKWDEIKSKLNKREDLTYDEFVELVGGVQGTLDKKTSSSITYQWLNEEGGYLSGYFDTKTNKCTMATGRF